MCCGALSLFFCEACLQKMRSFAQAIKWQICVGFWRISINSTLLHVKNKLVSVAKNKFVALNWAD
jgi:hypothetical protein